ncbi:cation/H(+) antiporter 15-like [Magnolia sinica]|uniref:cation/H(+) antiporter 15-like n=1 Tax=Magnolia sinica TaxID=86752 RepID=UPI0026589259|nr:cation/H(+) antiporter 15-like [Magnolia sinica]
MAMAMADDKHVCMKMPDIMDDILTVFLQILIILIVYRLIYSIIKHLGQPRIVAQLLAGVVLGRAGFSRSHGFREMVFPYDKGPMTGKALTIGRGLFMLLIGLEIDINYLKGTKYRSGRLIGGGFLSCLFLVLIFYKHAGEIFDVNDKPRFVILFLTLIFSSSASPILIHTTTELKIATTEVGRMAITSSLINDTLSLVIATFFSILMSLLYPQKYDSPFVAKLIGILLLGGGTYMIPPLTRWLNRQNKSYKDLRYAEVATILTYTGTIYLMLEKLFPLSGMLASFIFGLVMPREGKAVRTIRAKLTYPVNTFIMPLYFANMGIEADLTALSQQTWKTSLAILFIPFGKIAGTLVAVCYDGIRLNEGLLLSLLLIVKGHVDLALIKIGFNQKAWNQKGYAALVSMVVIISIVVCPLVTAIVRSQRRSPTYKYAGIEWQQPDTELRVLACVHSPPELPTMLNLIEASKGTDRSPLIAFLMQLIEFTNTVTVTTQMFYHQQEDFDEFQYGREDTIHINNAIDCFNQECDITIHQMSAVSEFKDMHQDVCNVAQDIRTAVIIVPFHRRQTVTGEMDKGNDGIRLTNKKLLRHATCTVGILVDRGLGGNTQILAMNMSHHVAVLFFSGPDDREALAFGCRMAEHPNVSLTVIRFQPTSARDYETGIGIESSKQDEVLVSISKHESEMDTDRAFLAEVYDRYVMTGIISYVEKFVENGAETVSGLSAMEGMFSLFIVGKGGRGLSPLTMGISEWEEYPELGVIGDLLASSDFTVTGSVLVIQQYGHSKKNRNKDEFKEDSDDEFAV